MPEPTRILRVIARLNVGGPALHVSYLTKGLDQRGYETLLVAGSVGPAEGSMEYVPREYGIEPVFLNELQREIAAGRDVVAVKRLRDLMREFRPHVLHTHTAKAGALGRLAASVAGAAAPPVVVHTFHGHVLRGYFDGLSTAVFRKIEQALAKRTDALVAVSPQVRDDLVRLGVAPFERFEVIRLGLDLESRSIAPPGARAEERAALAIDDDAFLVAWLGRMTEIKRVDDLLRSFARLARAEERARLLLVGDGPLRPSLEALAAELGVAPRVVFAGIREDVARIYAAADVVALSSANEGTPVSLIEALAARKPVVSTDVGGVADVVRAGETGLLVPPHDVGAFTDALMQLARDEPLRARLAAQAGNDVLARYSVSRLLDDMDALYRRLLERKPVGKGRPTPAPRGASRPLTPTLPRLEVERAPRRLRVLLLSQYFPPEVGATQSRMQAFAEYLAARGHAVTVIAEFPNHPHGIIPPEYEGRLFEDDRTNPYRVLRVWVKASREKTQRTRIAFYLSYMALATALAPVAGKADVVVATSPPLFTGVAGLALARLNRAPFVLDVRDLWPAAAVSLNQIPSDRVIDAAERLERFLYCEAAAVTAVTRPFCEHVDAVRRRAPKSVFLPNGTLEVFFDAKASGAARASLGAENGRFVVTFAGNFGIAQALPNVVDAARIAGDRVHFAFVGDGPMRDTIVDYADKSGVTNVSFVPQVPLDDVPPLLAASDALLVPLSRHPTFADFVPSKLIDFMAVGKPVLVAAAGEPARLTESAGAGIAVPPEDPEALARAAAWIAGHPDEARTLGARGRQFARSRLRSVQSERLEQLLFDLVC